MLKLGHLKDETRSGNLEPSVCEQEQHGKIRLFPHFDIFLIAATELCYVSAGLIIMYTTTACMVMAQIITATSV